MFKESEEKPIDLSVNFAGIEFRNPVITASGTYGFGSEYAPYCPLEALGGITLKGTTPEPRRGNPVPRLAETPAGMLNAIGLENPGLEEFVRTVLPRAAEFPTRVIANISGFSVEDYTLMAKTLQRGSGLAALEVNISCPNVKHGGMHFGTDPKSAEAVIRAVKQETDLPVIAKLSPNVTDIRDMARAVARGGADAISLINTLLGMSIDVERRKPVLANTFGGLSGPAVHPVAVRMVWEVYETVDLPIIGMGGITSWQDAVEFLLAGASIVSIGTGNFVNPRVPLDVINGIEAYCLRHGFSAARELTGLAHKTSR